MEPGDYRVPVPDRQGTLPGPDAPGPQGLLQNERQPLDTLKHIFIKHAWGSYYILWGSYYVLQFDIHGCNTTGLGFITSHGLREIE